MPDINLSGQEYTSTPIRGLEDVQRSAAAGDLVGSTRVAQLGAKIGRLRNILPKRPS